MFFGQFDWNGRFARGIPENLPGIGGKPDEIQYFHWFLVTFWECPWRNAHFRPCGHLFCNISRGFLASLTEMGVSLGTFRKIRQESVETMIKYSIFIKFSCYFWNVPSETLILELCSLIFLDFSLLFSSFGRNWRFARDIPKNRPGIGGKPEEIRKFQCF